MTRAVVYDLGAGANPGTALDVAAAALGRGEAVWAQVHGTGCLIADAFSAQGVAALLHARLRGRGAGLPVLVREPAVVHALFETVGLDAAALMAAHWPGPLTLLGPPTPSLHWDLGAAGRLSAVAVSMPSPGFAADLVARIGPCAYLQAHPDPAVVESAAEAHARMGDAVAVYVQEPPVQSDQTRLPTSIVDVRATAAVLVRPGAVPEAALRTTCPGLITADTGAGPQ